MKLVSYLLLGTVLYLPGCLLAVKKNAIPMAIVHHLLTAGKKKIFFKQFQGEMTTFPTPPTRVDPYTTVTR